MAGLLAGCLGTPRQTVTQRCTQPAPSSAHRLTLNYGIRYEYTPFFTRPRRSTWQPAAAHRAEPSGPCPN